MNRAKHIAIIMDGNGRWAEMQGLKRVKGHEAGADVVKKITTYCSNNPDIERLTLYAFSTENWKRPRLEVEFLMKLLERYLKNELPVYLENNVRFEPIGDTRAFSKSLRKTIKDVQEKTLHSDGLVQSLALNYGAQDEMIRAINKIKDCNDDITETMLVTRLIVNMTLTYSFALVEIIDSQTFYSGKRLMRNFSSAILYGQILRQTI